MAFLTWLQAAFGKRPIWIYDISLGGISKSYVAAPVNVSFGGVTYEASSISHSRPRITADIKRAETEIRLPRTNSFAQGFFASGQESTTVTIRRYFAEDTDQEAVYAFRGRVVSAAVGLATISLKCESSLTNLRSKGITPVIQRPCRHALYGSGCGVDRASFEDTLTATDWTAPVLTVTGADAQADGYYTGGVIRFSGNLRWIVGHVGTAITLDQPVLGLDDEIDLSGSATVYLAPGCDKTRSTCNARFTNIPNFGGFDWMTGDPYDGRNLFS